MIVYICDYCHTVKKRSECYNLHLEYAGDSRVELVNDGNFILCGKCAGQLQHMLRPKANYEGVIKRAEETDDRK